MSTINYTYNVIVDRFRQFAAGHFQLRRFTHGEISQADLEKEAEWPWMHVKPRAINYSPGTRAFSFEIFISDLPRDKEDKTGYQAESITDCSLIFQDLINEIHLGQMFGDDVLLTRPVNSEPFVEQYTHTLTGVTGIIELSMDYDWSACSIPASWNYNTPTNSNSSGFGSLQFIESLEQNGVFVSLDNDLEAPGNSYYYGTNGAGVKGWYASQAGTVTSVGLTAGTGISVSGGPITSSGSITVTNSAPDQVVALTAGTGITTSGTYPNFTITNSAPSSGGTVTSVAALTLGTTGTDLSSTVATSTTTPVITLNVPTASAANRGALSSADWSAFNSKLSGLTVGTTPITSGTVGRVLFEGTGNVLQESANLFWDNTNNRLGIGTTSPVTSLQIVGTTTLRAILPELDNTYNIGSATFRYNNIYARAILSGASTLDLYSTISSFFDSVGNRRMTIVGSSGNVIIGSSATDAGFKLDVNGTARVSGALTVGSGSLSNSSLLISRNITGSTNVASVVNTSTAQSDVTFSAAGFSSQIGTQNTAFTLNLLRHFAAQQGTIGAGSIVSNQFGFHVSSGLVLAQNNFGFRGEIPAGATNWNLYMNGTANNYLAGNLLIGTTTDVASSRLTIESTTQGVLFPRMTSVQKNAIATPATGLVVFDTTLGKLCVFSTTWQTITSV